MHLSMIHSSLVDANTRACCVLKPCPLQLGKQSRRGSPSLCLQVPCTPLLSPSAAPSTAWNSTYLCCLSEAAGPPYALTAWHGGRLRMQTGDDRHGGSWPLPTTFKQYGRAKLQSWQNRKQGSKIVAPSLLLRCRAYTHDELACHALPAQWGAGCSNASSWRQLPTRLLSSCFCQAACPYRGAQHTSAHRHATSAASRRQG